jgi:3',5'-cyclic AMP phosphodiesterase CpdA
LYDLVRWQGDLIPGVPPDIVLTPEAWTVTDDSITFAVAGDTGSGGRNQMDVARQMARTYQSTPYGLVLLAGDISYYGSIDDRYEEVFLEPYAPLIAAGVTWELAIGNHEIEEKKSDDAVAEIQAQVRRFGKPGTYYAARHGPVEVFVIDTSTPLHVGSGGQEQLEWLDAALAASTAPWKVALMHHPAYSSGRHGSELRVREYVQPILARHGVDLAFAGHDHDYERTFPQDGVVWIVSGAGCKLTDVGTSDFTAHSESTLQFMLVRIDGGVADVQAITTDGTVIDQVTLRKDGAP